MKSSLRWLLFAILALGLSGCAREILANRIVGAPNHGTPASVLKDPRMLDLFDRTYTRAWLVPVGPPAAELSVAEIEPGNYHFRYEMKIVRGPQGHGHADMDFNWDNGAVLGAKPIRPKGTIVLLHGVMDSKEVMMHWALYLAQAGYRAVLVDLRGNGRSTGDWMTYGVVEAADLMQMLDDLKRRGLADDRVGLLGKSYGADVGLLWAARDRRVRAIVALEPYSDPRRAVVDFANGIAPALAAKISEATFSAAIDRAGQLADFNWSDADPIAAVRHIPLPILFYHGARDTWIPPKNSEDLKAVAAPGSRLVLLPDDDHTILGRRLDPIAPEVAAWFAAHL